LRNSLEVFPRRDLVGLVIGNSEHDAGCCADEPLLRPNGKVTDEGVDRRDLLRRLLHLNRTDAPVDEALLHGLRLADDTEGLELQDGG